MAKGIKARGNHDLHRNITQAKSLIQRMELKRAVIHDAEIVIDGEFEVNNI